MKEQEQKKILYDSQEAAQFKNNISGWISSDGRFFGKDEHLARWNGCTHKICECGNEMNKNYTKCDSCRAKSATEKYFLLPIVEWDYVTPLCIYDDDMYFFSEDDLLEYCDDNELNPEDLMLVICKENRYLGLDSEYWDDILPEDGEVDERLSKKIDELNALIAMLPPASYSGDNKRIEYKNTNH